MSEDNRRLAAIMFTDLVGYSALTQRDEPLALELVETKQTLLAPLLAQHKGTLIKSLGDGLLIEFPSALQAVQCAMSIQGMLRGYNNSQPEDHQINIRIGIHLGDVEFKDGDVLGDGVNIASRIEPLAEPGGICISETVHDLVDGKISAKFDTLGKPELKNIRKEIEVFKVEATEIVTSNAFSKRAKLDQRLKIGSVVAVGVIAIVAAYSIIQSIFETDSGVPHPDEISSLAIMPFEDISTDQLLGPLGDGIAEEIRIAIRNIDGMRVIGRDSSVFAAERNLSTREAAESLGVQSILEGTIRQSGDQLRITARLVLGENDTDLWSEQFDLERGDLFQIMEEMARNVLIKFGYTTGPNDQLLETGTRSIEAFRLYSLGREMWSTRTEENLLLALEYFESAIEFDPNYAQPYVGLADVYQISAGRGYMPREAGYSKAEELASIALEKDDSIGEAYASLGLIYMDFHYDLVQAEQFFRNAIARDPQYPSAHQWYRILLNALGRRDEAFEQAKIARNLDPISPIVLVNYAEQLYRQKHFEAAIQELETVLEIEPQLIAAYNLFDNIHLYQGDSKIGEEKYRQALGEFPDNAWLHSELSQHYLVRRMFEPAQTEIEKAIELSPDAPLFKYHRALILVSSKRYEEAIPYIENLLAAMDDFPNYWWILAVAKLGVSQYEEALEAIHSGLNIIPPSSQDFWRTALIATQGVAYAKQNDRESAEQIIAEFGSGTTTYMPKARVYAALGDIDSMLANLNHMYETLSGNGNPKFMNVLPEFEPYRDDPGFREILAKMGLAD